VTKEFIKHSTSGPSSTPIPWGLAGNADFQALPQTSRIKTLEVKPSILFLSVFQAVLNLQTNKQALLRGGMLLFKKLFPNSTLHQNHLEVSLKPKPPSP
jgi:hypothetical protein